MNIENGKKVSIHYVGTLKDGTEFDSSRDRGEPLQFTMGSGEILPAFEKAVQGMEIGDMLNLSLTADEAYGQILPDAIQPVPKASFSPEVQLEVGNMVSGQAGDGRPIRATIESIEDEVVILDFNHPLAGKDINFDIELLEVEGDYEPSPALAVD